MPITLPPTPGIAVRRSCGQLPQGYAYIPQFAPESFLPDNLMLESQGIRAESLTAVAIVQEGDLDTSKAGDFRAVRIRRSTPDGTVERTVVVVDTGNHAHAVITNPNAPVLATELEITPQSESAVETATEEASLPAPDVSSDDVASTSGPTSTEVLQAQFAAAAAAKTTATTGYSGYSSAYYNAPQAVAGTYSTPTSSYQTQTPVSNQNTAGADYSNYISQQEALLGINNSGTPSTPTGTYFPVDPYNLEWDVDLSDFGYGAYG